MKNITALELRLRKYAEFMGVPSFAYRIGAYAIDKNGTVTGPASKELIDALEAKGFTSKNAEGEHDHE